MTGSRKTRILCALLIALPAHCFARDAEDTPIPPSPSREDPALRLDLTPAKHDVYVGEPLRVDVEWECELNAAALKQLRFDPAFFHHPSIEVDVPRSTAPEEKQIGLPVGGQRIIGRRNRQPENKEGLGTVSFSLFIRFTSPGSYSFPATRLELSRLVDGKGSFAPYASYFNNSLFETVEEDRRSERLFAEAEPFAIAVRPLPEAGRHASFSGLFLPCRFEASVSPQEGQVGDLMELDVRVFSEVASGFLSLPDLGQQSSLRHRFWIDQDVRRVWQPDGAEFLLRFRPLTSTVRAFPGLSFQVFNSASGGYELIRTPPIPLVVNEYNGQTVFERNRLTDGTSNLTDQVNGVWHNERAGKVNDILNRAVNVLADTFWLSMLLAPVLFLAGLPLIRERRRRAMDHDYRRQVHAYKAFRKLPEGDLQKWQAFRAFLAAVGGRAETAYTVGDAMEALSRFNVGAGDLRAVRDLFELDDCVEFGGCTCRPEIPRLNALARRMFQRVVKGVLMIALLCGAVATGEASSWGEAGQLFDAAHTAEAGSPESVARFAESALKFEEVARSGQRPGRAWYNAGNAWFEAGDLGRSIAAYLHARVYRPFDAKVRDNLAAARSLTSDRVAERGGRRWLIWPPRWIKAALVLAALWFWPAIVCHVRYRTRATLVTLSLASGVACLLAALLLVAVASQEKRGVVITDEIFARKGPGYHYAQAFHEPLHSGLECSRQELRKTWCRIELPDGRECWIPDRLVARITPE